MILENWFILNSITDAKLGNCKLVGNVYNRKDTPAGTPLTTSNVILIDDINRKCVFTESSSPYILGRPDQGFADALRNLGILYNPADPLGFLHERL
jgi:hypothetical protein